MNREKRFCAGFGIKHLDRSLTCVLLLFVVLLSSLLVGYVEREQWLTRTLTTTSAPHLKANNSRIWFRETPIYKDKNRSEAAMEREPALVLALEQLRLEHVAHGSTPKGLFLGEYTNDHWERQPEIDSLWVKLIDHIGGVRHVCHVGAGGGYAGIMYLQGLPNATVSVYDSCDGDRKKECDVFEKFVHKTYGKHRFRLVRTDAPSHQMVYDVRGSDFDLEDEELSPLPAISHEHHKVLSDEDQPVGKHKLSGEDTYHSTDRRRHSLDQRDENATLAQNASSVQQQKPDLLPACDWVGVDIKGNEDTSQDMMSVLRHAAACPNVLYVNSVGRDTENPNLAAIAQAWETGVKFRAVMQTVCDECYDGESECTYCFGELLCGSVFAAAQQELEEEAMGTEPQGDEDDDAGDESLVDDEHTKQDSLEGSESKSKGSKEKYLEEEIEKQQEHESDESEYTDATVSLGHGVKVISPVIKQKGH